MLRSFTYGGFPIGTLMLLVAGGKPRKPRGEIDVGSVVKFKGDKRPYKVLTISPDNKVADLICVGTRQHVMLIMKGD